MKKRRLSTLVVFLSILAVTALYQIWGITGNARGIAAAAVPEVAFAGEQIHHVQLQAAASFPFYDGFESGVLGSAWSISTTNQGRVQVSSTYPYTGAYSLLLDDSQNDAIYSTAAAILAIDLSGQSQVDLDFWWDEWDVNGTGDGTQDGVFISDDDGANWLRILSFDADPTGWRHQVIDLDAAAAANNLALNNHFQIKFQFHDDDPIPTDGYAIDELQIRPNAPPTLSWVGTTNYQQDGLHPESSDNWDNYVYRIKYSDLEANPPTFVRVHIEKGGSAIAGSPFEMSCDVGNYAVGVSCAYTQSGLEAGIDYSYYFVAQDNQGNPAAPTVLIDAPDVTISYRTYLPVLMKDAGPPAGAPYLNPIDNPTGNYKFTVTWTTVERATSYTLQEDDNDVFSSPADVYVGSGTSKQLITAQVGTYYYRVKASNKFGESGWSNTQSVVVSVAPPPCPQSGNWSGAGQHFNMEFDVVGSGNLCSVQNATGHLSAVCCSGGTCWSLYVEYILGLAMITNHQFTASSSDGTTQVKGTFTTPTTVEGTWSYREVFPYPYATCTGSGTWAGSYGP